MLKTKLFLLLQILLHNIATNSQLPTGRLLIISIHISKHSLSLSLYTTTFGLDFIDMSKHQKLLYNSTEHDEPSPFHFHIKGTLHFLQLSFYISSSFVGITSLIAFHMNILAALGTFKSQIIFQTSQLLDLLDDSPFSPCCLFTSK